MRRPGRLIADACTGFITMPHADLIICIPNVHVSVHYLCLKFWCAHVRVSVIIARVQFNVAYAHAQGYGCWTGRWQTAWRQWHWVSARNTSTSSVPAGDLLMMAGPLRDQVTSHNWLSNRARLRWLKWLLTDSWFLGQGHYSLGDLI